jgi:hypothetical protein
MKLEPILLVAVFAIGLGVGCIGTGTLADSFWMRQAIKHGAAYYHPETGEFTWKGEAE